MEIPAEFTIVEGHYFTDGGSIVLIAEGPNGTRYQITLGQHRFLEAFDPNVLPGRLYFNHLLIPVRSEMEAEVLALLKAGEIRSDDPAEPEGGAASTGEGPVVVVGDDLKEYYARVTQGKEEAIRYLIENLVDFVESRKYVRIAKNIERKVGKER